MKHTNQATKKEAKKGTTAGSKPGPKREGSNKEGAGKAKGNKYKMDFIKKDNFDTMGQKLNITEIRELQVPSRPRR